MVSELWLPHPINGEKLQVFRSTNIFFPAVVDLAAGWVGWSLERQITVILFLVYTIKRKTRENVNFACTKSMYNTFHK